MKEQEIYGKIYDITSENYSVTGRNLPYTRKAFLASMHRGSGEADLFDLLELENLDFMQAANCKLLIRAPYWEQLNEWGGRAASQDRTTFRKAVLKKFMNSGEYKFKGIMLRNNVYPDIAGGEAVIVERNVNMGAQRVGLKERIKPMAKKIFRKLPVGMRRVIKRMLGRG